MICDIIIVFLCVNATRLHPTSAYWMIRINNSIWKELMFKLGINLTWKIHHQQNITSGSFKKEKWHMSDWFMCANPQQRGGFLRLLWEKSTWFVSLPAWPENIKEPAIPGTSLVCVGTPLSYLAEYLKLAARDRTLSLRPSSSEIRTTEEKAAWRWQSSLCVSPWCWCCWWRWVKAVSLTSAISHYTFHLRYWLNTYFVSFCDCFCWHARTVPSFKGPLCCTRYQDHPIPVKRLKNYIIQEDTGYCNIKAVM